MIILAYHRVTPETRGSLSVTVRNFRAQLGCLLDRGLRNVSLDSEVRSSRWRYAFDRTFAITFDDGYRDNYFHAMPVLRDMGLTATIFVTVDFIGSERLYPWDEKRPEIRDDPRSEDKSVTWEQLREMETSGAFSVGSHTLSHPELAHLTSDRVRHEVVESKQVLERRLLHPIQLFCYPRGSLNRSVVTLVREAGYTLAVVTPPRPVPSSLYTLPRVGVYRNTDLGTFRRKTGRTLQAILWAGAYPYGREVHRKALDWTGGKHASPESAEPD